MAMIWADQTITNRAELLVLLALADFSNDNGECWPSVETLAFKARCSQRGAQTIVSALIRRGKLEVDLNAGRNSTNVYRIVAGGVQALHPADTCLKNGRPSAPDPSGSVINRQELTKEGELQLGDTKKKKEPAALPDIPEAYRTPDVITAWKDWLQHRKEIKKPMTPLAAKGNFKELVEWGAHRWVEAIYHSIRNGYQGIFPPRALNATNGAAAVPLWKQIQNLEEELRVLDNDLYYPHDRAKHPDKVKRREFVKQQLAKLQATPTR